MTDKPGGRVMHLWEADHPYYCEEANYYVGGTADPPYDHLRFESWAEFDWKKSDPDMNLLFRWDWSVPDEDDFSYAQALPPERLYLFWVLQRKGRFMVTSFPVRRDEEPEIRAWLTERLQTILAIWRPLTPDGGYVRD